MCDPAAEVRFFATGLDHPEGVAVGCDGSVYAGGEAGQVYRVSSDGRRVEQIANTGGSCLGIALDRAGRIFVCDARRQAVMAVEPGGHCEVFADRVGNREFALPNFAVFDAQGRLYVSDSGDWENACGAVYRIQSDGSAEVFHAGPFAFANGLALAANEDFLYVAESARHRVLRIPIQNNASAGEPEVFVRRVLRVPDGLALDRAGNLYVTCYASDTIYLVRHGRGLSVVCRDGDAYALNRPTNCAFAGPDSNRLVIANFGGEHLSVIDVAEPGMPLYHQRET
jgi:gluconolactonase